MYWIASYFVEIAKLYTAVFLIAGYRAGEKGKKKLILALYLMAVMMTAVSLLENEIKVSIITAFIVLTIITLLKRRSDWVRVIIVYFIVSLLDAAIAGIFCGLAGWSSGMLRENETVKIVLSSCTLICLVLITIIKRVSNKERPLRTVQGKGGILFAELLLLSAGIVPIQLKILDMQDWKLAINVSLCIILFLILIIMCMQYAGEKEYEKAVREECELLLDMQREYCSRQQMREEETRRFRHDINNHMFVLQQLLNSGRIHKGKKYLKDMLEESKKLGLQIDTGNFILNAVISDIINEDDNIAINWNGIFPKKTKIKDVDLCILFSNMIKNAREAALELDEKSIEITVKTWQRSLSIICKNRNISSGFLKIGEGHGGLGLVNMEQVVRSYGGEMKIEGETEFKVSIIFYDIIL